MPNHPATGRGGPWPHISHHLDAAGIELHVAEWGDPNGEPLIMWHGLARTGRDFDAAAAALARRYRVLCPDTPGRGLSQWMPADAYRFDTYMKIAEAMLAAFAIDRLRWVGTSMGGQLGMRLAAGPLAGRISHLVVNDIAPELQAGAVARIGAYVGNPPRFDRMTEFETYLREIYAPFGNLSDAEWRTMTDTSARRLPDGGFIPHYDPRIARHLLDQPDDWVCWDAWDRLGCPILLIRGAESDLLSAQLAARMEARSQSCRTVVVPGCGHAPALNNEDQLAILANFLAS